MTMTTTRIDRGSTATTTIYSEGGDLVFERTFDAPLALVWKAFTDPELIPRWWGPHATMTKVVELDVRPGGRWRFVSSGPDREDVTSAGFPGRPPNGAGRSCSTSGRRAAGPSLRLRGRRRPDLRADHRPMGSPEAIGSRSRDRHGQGARAGIASGGSHPTGPTGTHRPRRGPRPRLASGVVATAALPDPRGRQDGCGSVTHRPSGVPAVGYAADEPRAAKAARTWHRLDRGPGGPTSLAAIASPTSDDRHRITRVRPTIGRTGGTEYGTPAPPSGGRIGRRWWCRRRRRNTRWGTRS
jgi:hypothetical protein